MSALIPIGYWRRNGERSSSLPDPRTLVDKEWLGSERDVVVRYLRRGDVHEQYRGSSHCRICDVVNGSQDLTDGVYVWPRGFAHYVEEHLVRPPQEFIDHVLRAVRYPFRSAS